jgi:hypothetical protein
MKKSIILAILLLFGQKMWSQATSEFRVPGDYSFEEASDYEQYEEDILACIEWLEKSPLNKYPEIRKEASEFLITWIEGAPNVTIELHQEILKFAKANQPLLVIFMGGWTAYELNNPEEKNKILGCVAGLESAIRVYKKGIGVRSDKEIEKLIKLEERGQLEKWVRQQMGG